MVFPALARIDALWALARAPSRDFYSFNPFTDRDRPLRYLRL